MDTGDVVLHKPTGEKWVVAYVKGEHLCCCGWPESLALVSDCELVTTAESESRLELLRQIAAMPGSDSRKSYAVERLAMAEEVLPSIY